MENDFTLCLANGQRLGYGRFGRPGGEPAFYFHGLPGSRCEGALFHQACHDANVELIALDRPGYGLSEPVSGDRLARWPELVEAVADQLEFDRFLVLAASGGGPYALACASTSAARVRATGICCGLGDLAQTQLRASMGVIPRLGFRMAEISPALLRSTYGLAAGIAARVFPGVAIDAMGWLNTRMDRDTLREPAVRAAFVATLRAAFQQGAAGGCEDMRAAVRGWPFDLTRIAGLQLWHGDQDSVVPLSHSGWVAHQVPGARLTVIAGEGHFSLPVRYAVEVVRSLLEAAPD